MENDEDNNITIVEGDMHYVPAADTYCKVGFRAEDRVDDEVPDLLWVPPIGEGESSEGKADI